MVIDLTNPQHFDPPPRPVLCYRIGETIFPPLVFNKKRFFLQEAEQQEGCGSQWFPKSEHVPYPVERPNGDTMFLGQVLEGLGRVVKVFVYREPSQILIRVDPDKASQDDTAPVPHEVFRHFLLYEV